ncbi:MAG: hypothetical protein U0573_10600 [Phycisphaerales bacterium]|nr:hypothetical protein [Planctomycetota bacterium]
MPPAVEGGKVSATSRSRVHRRADDLREIPLGPFERSESIATFSVPSEKPDDYPLICFLVIDDRGSAAEASVLIVRERRLDRDGRYSPVPVLGGLSDATSDDGGPAVLDVFQFQVVTSKADQIDWFANMKRAIEVDHGAGCGFKALAAPTRVFADFELQPIFRNVTPVIAVSDCPIQVLRMPNSSRGNDLDGNRLSVYGQ